MKQRANVLEMIRREVIRTVTRTPQKAIAKLTGQPWPPRIERVDWNRGVTTHPHVPRHSQGLAVEDIESLIGHDHPVILEIGANQGQDSRKLLDHFAQIKLFCFEPDPRAIGKFRGAIADPRCTLVEKAVAAETGSTTFWQSGGNLDGNNPNWDQSGSIHRPTGHLEMAPQITFDSVIKVATVSLDDWMAQHPELDTIDLLWMDTQGAEHDVIAGAVKTLPKVRYLYSEFYQTPMYEGQRNLDSLLGMLPGFSLAGIYDCYNFLAENREHAGR
jgi:2-O-methyltransferase